MWRRIREHAVTHSIIGPCLELKCPKHPETLTRVVKADDFKRAQFGGCNLLCGARMKCGHTCTRSCHPFDCSKLPCLKPCARKHEGCGHKCPLRCYMDCGPCCKRVIKDLPCGHSTRCECHKDVQSIVCQAPCPKSLPCGHPCSVAFPSNLFSCWCSYILRLNYLNVVLWTTFAPRSVCIYACMTAIVEQVWRGVCDRLHGASDQGETCTMSLSSCVGRRVRV